MNITYSHNMFKKDEFTMSSGSSKKLVPSIYKITCYGGTMPNTFHSGEAILDNWSDYAAAGGKISAYIQVTSPTWCYSRISPGGSETSPGYQSYDGSNYDRYCAYPGFAGGDGIGFYLLGKSSAPIVCAGGGGGIGGYNLSGSNYVRYVKSYSSYSSHHNFTIPYLSDLKGGRAGESGKNGGSSFASGGSVSSTEGKGGVGPTKSAISSSTTRTVYTASGGSGGGGWPAGGGGSESSTQGRTSGTSSYKGANGGDSVKRTTHVTLEGITYDIEYYEGGNGGSGSTKRYTSSYDGNYHGGSGAGGRNYSNSSFAQLVSSEFNSVTTNVYVLVEQYIIYNGIVLQPYKCTLECSEGDEVLGGQSIEVYISNVEKGYTLESVTISAPGFYQTVPIDPDEHLETDGSYTVAFDLPELVDVDFVISNTVKVNPYITLQRNNTWSVMPNICTMQGDRYYYDISGETPLFKPEINSYMWIDQVYMRNGWKFKECTMEIDGVEEVRFLQIGDRIFIDPSWEGKNITITVYEQEDQIPFYFVYYLNNIYDGVYEEAFRKVIYGSVPGQLLVYFPEECIGYHYSGGEVPLNVYLAEHGSALSLYYEPNEYNISVLYGQPNAQSSIVGKALYTEPVSVTFRPDLYDGDARDEFCHWKTEEGMAIPDDTSLTSGSFPMPHHDLRIYPVMRPYRKNSNVYRNKYPVDDVYGNYIYNGYHRNLEHDGDIVQPNHGFKVGDVIYYDESDGLYKLAIADGTEKSIVVGIVHNVNMYDVFGYQAEGPTDVQYEWDETRSSIMFLSDKIPGKLVFYEDIENEIYVPVGIWTKHGIIMDIAQPTTNIVYKPYPDGDLGPEGEDYTSEEIVETIDTIKNNMARR